MTESARPRRWAVPQNHDLEEAPVRHRASGVPDREASSVEAIRGRRPAEEAQGRLGLKAGDFLGVD
jgi:hypothetical protein